MSRTTRRAFMGGMATTGAIGVLSRDDALARQATPVAAGAGSTPQYATVRVRTQPSAGLNQAIFPDVMARFLPPTAAIPGFLGYTFAFDDADPASALTFSTFSNEAAAGEATVVAQDYVDQLDPRFVTETPLAAEGRVRMFAATGTASVELPPFLHGAVFTMRDQTTAAGVDIEAAIAMAQETLIPLFLGLPGFVLYCWFERLGGRIAINVWETSDDLAAASEALVAWREEHFTTPTASEEVSYNGTIGYATIAGLT